MTFSEICRKEVVQIETGVCLGRIDDIVLNPVTAEIEQFIMYGRPKLLGLLGREEPFYIKWGEIDKFGVDAILIRTPLPVGDAMQKKGIFARVRAQF